MSGTDERITRALETAITNPSHEILLLRRDPRGEMRHSSLVEADADFELLRQWRNGDRRAGNALVDRHHAGLRGFFCAKAPIEAVDDLVQQTFTAVVEGRDRFRGDASFRAYMFGAARLVLLTYFRAKKKDARVDPLLISVEMLDPSPSQLVEFHQQQRLLAAALRRIPLDLQIVLELHYWEEMPTGDLAAVLDIPQGTVKSRLRRAKERLREALATFTPDADVVESTLSRLRHWAQEIREGMPDPDPDTDPE